MYFTYDRNQTSVDCVDKTSYRLNVTGGDYRPTWLVRVSDWKKVPGEQATDGYHTLSYCWEQSGRVEPRNDGSGEYDCIDEGRHCIIDHVDERKASNFFKRTVKKYVKYEGLLQQVCKDFQIEYLWYDKVCIDQSDKNAKLKEIKQMHKIYRNARYTIAMIPEVLCSEFRESMEDGFCAYFIANFYINGSQWMRRSWTLEEVMMSKCILIVGNNANMFQHSLHSVDIPTTVDTLSEVLLDFGRANGEKCPVSQALSEAHLRRSTKSHDMIFALANIFPHVLDGIDISYDTDIQTTFNSFYRTIAAKDLSILYFGLDAYGARRFPRPFMIEDNYSLPSWSGIAGTHPSHHVNITGDSSLSYYIDGGNMCMYVKTKSYWDICVSRYHAYPSPYFKFTYNWRQRIKNYKCERRWALPEKALFLHEWAGKIGVNMPILQTTFITHLHHPSYDLPTKVRPLSLTEDCKECIVLPILMKAYVPLMVHDEARFFAKNYKYMYFLPVLRKRLDSTDRYKSVGIYYLGEELEQSGSSPFYWNHSIGRDDIKSRKEPQEMLDILFENDYHDNGPKEFIIE